jgi:signal transduction histidine kinase
VQIVRTLTTPAPSNTPRGPAEHKPRKRYWPVTVLYRHASGLHAATVLAGIVALSVSLFVGALVQRNELQKAAGRAAEGLLVARAEDIARFMVDGTLHQNLDDGGLPGWVQVLDSNGEVTEATKNIASLRQSFVPQGRALTTVGGKPQVKVFSRLGINGGKAVLVASLKRSWPNGSFTVLVALPVVSDHAVIQHFDRLLLTLFPVMVATDGLLAWWLVRRALRPVESIRSHVASISATNLHKRVPLPPGQDSVSRLAVTMNAMLSRLESSNEQLRQFCADASHELRSPLAIMRTNLEASALENPEPAWQTMVDQLLLDQDRLENLVSDLFLLTKLDSQQPLQVDPLDLGALVSHELSRRPIPADQHRVVATPSCLVLGDVPSIVRVLCNLVDNAERYVSHTLYVAVKSTGAGVELIVDNDGPPIPPDKSLEVFQRFSRLDDARNCKTPGNGLGLAIVAEIMNAHGGSVRFEPSEVGARFVATFPLLTDQPEDLSSSGSPYGNSPGGRYPL